MGLFDWFPFSWSGDYEAYYANQSKQNPPPVKSNLEKHPASEPPPKQLNSKKTKTENYNFPKEKIAILLSSRLEKELLPKNEWLEMCKLVEEQMKYYRFLPYQVCNCYYIGDGKAWAPYNLNNQRTLFLAINQINYFFENIKELDEVVQKTLPTYYIDYRSICFGFRDNATPNDLPRSYLLYSPQNKRGKYMQYPLIAFFNTLKNGVTKPNEEYYLGELYYAMNGELAKAVIHCTKHGKFAEFVLSVIGKTFMISKIKTVGTDGKWFVLYDCSWKFTDYMEFE